jgi:hypothetical protein
MAEQALMSKEQMADFLEYRAVVQLFYKPMVALAQAALLEAAEVLEQQST